MKKLILIPTLLVSALGLAQAIDVSTTSHTVPQLVNDVLINSPCVSATNVTWKTGTNYGSSNGIGYFQNTNPNFPMPAGVVLSTGNALSAEGPNMTELNDGIAGWIGDTDLEATLAAAGIPMESINATVLEFDFTPISPNFSFDFIFASEEYGNFQCQFSDAFAFLLTNMNTGVTTNLAVVPTTNLPISVVTIRDFLYNSSCPSANAQYFGSFNGGSAAAGSATNFNGQTVMLNASSNLTPNVPYHIKLVIADRSDSESDSAIFISSDSFNIGQDVLGLDLTVANNTALCPGETLVLDTDLSTTEYAFVWTKNGDTIVGESGPSITVTQPGVYGVTYTNTVNTCEPVTDLVTVEYSATFSTPDPVAIYKCDIGSATYTYDLSINTPIVSTGISPAPEVSYHASQANAENNISPLPTNYVGAPNQIIYIRIKKANNPCFVVKSFQLLVTPPAVAHQPADLHSCARSMALNNAFFNLSQQNAVVLGGQSAAINTVTYYTTLADAQNQTSPVSDSQFHIFPTQVIYVRVQNATDPSCFSITSFNVIVTPIPPVDDFADVVVCEPYVLPALTNGNYFTGYNGTGSPMAAGDVIGETQMIYIFNQPGGPTSCPSNSNFKVTVLDPNTLSPTSSTNCGTYTLPSLAYGDYYTGPGATGTMLTSGTILTESQTVYVYYATTEEPFCVIDTDFVVTILPKPEVGTFDNVFDCVSYTLPSLATGHYYSAADGQGTPIAAGTVITTTQTIYVHAENAGTIVCSDDDSFVVVIGFDTPADINQCVPYVLPALPVGGYFTGPGGTGNEIEAGTSISTSTTLYVYIENDNTPDCMADVHFSISIAQPPIDTLPNVMVCDSYILPTIANGDYYTESGGLGTMLNAGDAITATQRIYIFAAATADCTNESSFMVTLIPPPAIDSRSDIDICDSYVLTALAVGNYYTGPDGTGTMLNAGTVITTTQTIYIYAITNTNPACSAQNSFTINIFSVEADAPDAVTVCDSYTLPALTIGDYYMNSGGPAFNLAMLHAGDVINTTTTLYIYTESGERINCSDENILNITINHTPVIGEVSDVTVCESYTLPALTVGNYYTGTAASGTMLHAGDVLTTTQTVYIYAETATSPNCWSEKAIDITIFNVDDLQDVTTCESYTLPALSVGKYYTGPNGTGTMLNAGTVISNSTTLYVYAISPFTPTCTDETSFTLTIVDTPVANAVPLAMTTVCDEDGTNDGAFAFDLSQLDATVLGSQTGTEFSITYYESLANANTGTNPVTASTLATVYARVSNALAPNCFAVRTITIVVNRLPMPTPVGGIICFDTETQTLLNPYIIHSGLPSSGYVFQWKNEQGVIVGTGMNYTATLPGTYTVTATRTTTGCTSVPVSVVVAPSEPALVTYEVSDDFADNQSITVIATGTGDYEYMLDNGVWQDSPVFENVSSGIHTITVRDKNGCGTETEQALVVNYPHFFTPNGDGYNDTWNIDDLQAQTSARIHIFDRYGKFIASLRPSGEGWDGNYNGQPMPSTDYWFVVDYEDNGNKKEFRAHFAMKR